MTQITFGYSDSEDRIWLVSSDGARYWLTRRLLAGLLPPVTELLEKTVPGGSIPNALPANQRIRLEHQEAMVDDPDGQPALERNKETRQDGAAPTAPPVLVTSMTIHADESHCGLIISAGAHTARLDLNRLDFHRLLQALYQITVTASWDIGGLPDWLAGFREAAG